MMTNNGPVKWTGEKLPHAEEAVKPHSTIGAREGMGATVALPFLDAMVPGVQSAACPPSFGEGGPARRSPIKLVCIEQVHGAAGSSPFGLQQNLWSPGGYRS